MSLVWTHQIFFYFGNRSRLLSFFFGFGILETLQITSTPKGGYEEVDPNLINKQLKVTYVLMTRRMHLPHHPVFRRSFAEKHHLSRQTRLQPAPAIETNNMSSIVYLAVCFCIVALAAALPHAKSAASVTIAPGVHQPLVNLGGVTSKPSNYSSWLTVGGRGLDTVSFPCCACGV